MDHLLHLMFRCDGDVMENLVFCGSFWDLNGACVAFADRKVRGLRPLCRRRYRYALSKPQSGSAVNRIFGGFSSTFAALIYMSKEWGKLHY